MKKINSLLGIMLSAMVMLTLWACSGDEVVTPGAEKDYDGWHSAKVNMNVTRASFDQEGSSTRVVEDGWKDGDRIYLILTDKDGGKVQAYVQYSASAGDWGQVEYDGYKSYLTCTTPRKVQAYYFDGSHSETSASVTFTEQTGVYVCTNGTYTYPSDGDLSVSVALVPLTGRIKFAGAANLSATIGGIITYTGFSRTTGVLTQSESGASVKVQSGGYTPYIYASFIDKDNPSLVVTSGGDSFQTVFESTTPILKTGRSGYMNLPTADSHRGWKQIVPVSGVTLDKTSIMIDVNQTATLTATITPSNATEQGIIWSSSNTSVATVSNGVVTAKAYGTATITATSMGDASKKATCVVTVSKDKSFTVGGVTFNMKLVEKGTFQMGSTTGDSDEAPVHSVTLTKDYYMGETEVTQALWKAVTGYSPTSSGSSWSSTYGIGDDYPAYYISYEDVQSFVSKLNSLTGETFRMPTEAEWEYAAKGGNKSKGYTYSGSNTIGNVAWYTENSGSKTHPVKTKAANELGIYDMSGNVWEWCSDWYGSYSSSAQTNPTGATSGSSRVLRGGSWYDSATICRCANRASYAPSDRSYYVGFRLALSAQ